MKYFVIAIVCLLFFNCKSNLNSISEYEDSQNNQSIVKFEIKDELGILLGATIIADDSTIVVTNFDGIADIKVDNLSEIVKLRYLGKPTSIKIIKNCDFIKVDISKGKAFYYKDNKFIKSKKLIVE